MNRKIKQGDLVQIVCGKDRVKKTKTGAKTTKTNQGKVKQVFIETGKIVVDGLNMRIKHLRPKRQGETGQKIEFPAPLNISNVMLVCPNCKQATRVGYKLLDSKESGKKKIRICRKCQQSIDVK